VNRSDFADLVPEGGVVPDLRALDKAGVLAALAHQSAGFAGVAETLILERLRAREALGSTGFGLGAAIPHARIEGLVGVVVILARLAAPVDFGALDGEPVDLLVLLLSPEAGGADHLKALARISRALRYPDILDALRAAPDAAAMRAIIGAPA